MNLTNNDLLVLGFLLERPMHGYEIGQALKSEDVGMWFEISSAAVYYSLNKLHRLGLIAEAHSRGVSGDRAVYHVTRSGRQQFLSDMRGLLASTDPIRTEYDLGISLLNRLPRDEAEPLLRERIAFLREWVAELRVHASDVSARPLRKAILEHAIALAEVDITWLTQIADDLLTAGECDPFTGDLMTMQGDLADFHLPDLIKLIVSGNHSGTLVISDGVVKRSMTFEQGRPHCAGSQLSGEPVTDPAQVMEDVLTLFRWKQGDYVFDQRGCLQEGCVLLKIDADSLILAGARCVDGWEIIQRVVPSSQVVFERRDSAGATERDALDLRLEEAEVLSAVDGLRDVTALAQRTDLTEFETSRVLYGLALVDLVQPADPDKQRLRRVFREFAELMCRGAIPFRTSPEEATACETEVNRRCAALPVAIRDGRIEDKTGADLTADALAEVYRTFLQTQHAVLGERLGKAVAEQLQQQVLEKISPTLKATLTDYELL